MDVAQHIVSFQVRVCGAGRNVGSCLEGDLLRFVLEPDNEYGDNLHALQMLTCYLIAILLYQELAKL